METDMALSWLSELGKRVSGSMDGLFYTLVAFVVIHYITGVCVAIHNKQLSSDVGAHGNRQEDRDFCAGVPEVTLLTAFCWAPKMSCALLPPCSIWPTKQ